MATIDPLTRAFDSIKIFHGTSQDNSRDWCDRAEIIFNAFNINDADRLTRIGIKLENAAFDWYRDNQGPHVTWLNFRQSFERAFPPPDKTQNRHLSAEQINQRKQGRYESVHDYYYALDKLCREYDSQMSPIDKTIKLVGGLRHELKEKMLPLNVQTPEQFMIQAKNFESSEKVMANYHNGIESHESGEPTYTFESNEYPMVAASRPYHQQSYRTQQSHQSYSKPSFVNNYGRIQSNMNHRQTTTNQAPFFQRQHKQNINYQHQETKTSPNSNINHHRCFQCGQPGHIQRNCPQYLKEYKGQ